MARDHAVHLMEGLCASNRSKDSTIARLQQEKENLETQLAEQPPPSSMKHICCKQKDILKKPNVELATKLEVLSLSPQPRTAMMSPAMHDILSPIHETPRPDDPNAEPVELIMQARFAVLADLPIPEDMSIDTLVPIIIPTPFTLQDFLGTVTGSMKMHLTDYRVFQEKTTSWCPDREEHGYYLTPLFKCSTNPRIVAAHRWNVIDLDAELNKSSECFFNKDGKWYYAGVYRTFKLKDITPQEWIKLPVETTQAIVKETVQHRKNTSPQNIYEVGQLYAAGALKTACIGLQCIGFNNALYKGLLSQAEVCTKTGRWRGSAAGLGMGTMWNANVGSGLADATKTTDCAKAGDSVSPDWDAALH
ncbi:hypothetical protein PHLGIDRAFT_416150 [Phlebiopsis gigantea 11061_1 CR5-6]|uniref:DUF6697 domain-containing protein n=1 Tax=Phlebiopsis gigantea (strain 11061_1 CR5-6) TaxID=745531 RepID=A0A0C3PLU4_PHLG1|nr:hypothetical protein PHLGIDRAFT_416150 [Phlebiopsis gigantea 11061_1 CR5-6]